jgi:3-deoxy-7-phosphoheptulonate synthase
VSIEAPPSLVLVIDPESDERERAIILAAAARVRAGALVTSGDGWAAVTLGDGTRGVEAESFRRLPGVLRVVPVSTPYRLAALELFGDRVAVGLPPPQPFRARPKWIGSGRPLTVMVSCSALSDGLPSALRAARDAGATLLFGGEFPPPKARLGDTVPDISELCRLAEELDLGLCLEVSDAAHIDEVSRVASLLQVGSRNMQDFRLLRALGQATRPVLLRRGPGATVEEFILAAEYILIHGNGRVILCESGIRTFDAVWRPRLEINALPLIRGATHLPVMADPSTAAPEGAIVPAVARAIVAAGADGLVIELGEGGGGQGDAAIDVATFTRLMDELRQVASAVGRWE